MEIMHFVCKPSTALEIPWGKTVEDEEMNKNQKTKSCGQVKPPLLMGQTELPNNRGAFI